MELTHRERAAAEEILAAIPPVRDAVEPCLPPVSRALREILRAEMGAAYGVARTSDGIQVSFVHEHGFPPAFVAEWRGATSGTRAGIGQFDAAHPEPAQRNVPLTRADLARLTGVERPALQPILERHGVALLDHLRVLLCDGPRLLAWLGALRARPFDAAEKRILRAVTPTLLRRLRLEEQVAEVPLLVATLDATLRAIPSAALLLGERGDVRHANAAGRALLDRDPALARRLAADVRDGRATERATAVSAPGLPLHHLFVLEATATVGTRVEDAGRRWGLTPKQAVVLELLAHGLTNRAIADRARCAEKTVEAHVSAILAKAGLASRTELVAALL